MRELVLRGGQVLGASGADGVAADVVIRDDRIAAVGRAPEVTWAPDAEVVDVSGMTIIPGLIDCHDHLVLDGNPSGAIPAGEPLEESALKMAAGARATLAAGFTTVRDLGGRRGIEFKLRRYLDRNLLRGPRLLLAGQILTIDQGIAGALDGMFRVVTGVDDLISAVRQEIDAGADVIKVMGSGALLQPAGDAWRPHFERAELEAVVLEAGRHGKRVAVHAHDAVSIRNAVEAGVHSIEHGTLLCDDPELAGLMASKGTFYVPTLLWLRRIVDAGEASGVSDRVRGLAVQAVQKHVLSFQMALKAGVRIACGTDTGSPMCPHGGNAQELELMVGAGMSPYDALLAATSVASECLEMATTIGALSTGKLADLVVLDGNPLDDIGRIQRSVKAVVHRGNLHQSPVGSTRSIGVA